jgi:NAD(P)-dependent dehydrogenase (short-subunit alcohol dehydrogenase family)
MAKGDVSDDETCRSIVEQVVGEFGRIDILVNNAAKQGEEVSRFEDLEPQMVRYSALPAANRWLELRRGTADTAWTST